MKKYAFIVLIALTLTSCNQKEKTLLLENSELSSKIDSLQLELVTSQKASSTLVQAMTLMDSIDLGRKLIRMSLENSDSNEEFLEQMSELNTFVAQTTEKIASLEKTIKESKSAQNTYAKNLKDLKAELQQQKDAIALLQAKLNDEQSNNQKLTALNNLQAETILSQDEQIAVKTLEIELMERQISEMNSAFKINEADAHFTKGEAYALAAQRTKLAPAKKKATYKLALENYRKAFDLGREDAKPKIETIEKKLH